MRPLWMLLLTSTVLAAAPQPIFNGKDLSGWVHSGPTMTFGVNKDGELFTSGAGHTPNWLRTEREYENFRLHFEYKLAQWAEAAVYLRAPREGRPAQSGIAILLAHDFHKEINSYVTGGIAGVRPPKTLLQPGFGVWQSVDILLDGDRLRVVIDDILLQDADLSQDPELRFRLRRGFIGFPDMGYAYSLRNLQIDDLGNREKLADLFDGRSLDGWQLRGGGYWSVHEGVLQGANGHGVLYAPGVYADFELTLLVRTHNRVNSGVFLRGAVDEKQSRGFEVQIYSPIDGVYPTGSVYGIERSRIEADLEGRWLLLQIRVQGGRCLVRVDGTTVAESDRVPEANREPGRIGLQIHKEDAWVEFRDLRVRRL